MVDEEIKEIEEALENDNKEKYENKWEEAHEKYDTGEQDMLENMVHGLTASHALKTMRDYKGAFSKKGKYLDYDEWHSFSASSALIGLSYVLHPLVLSLWIYLTKLILDHSIADVRSSETDHFIETLDVFGKELWYYLGGALVSGWFFEEFTRYEIVLGDAGTLAQLTLEMFKLLSGF